MADRVFLSYMREDTKPVNDLFRLLKANNVNAWLDLSDIRAGSNWRRKLASAISDSEFFVPCFSRAYGKTRKSFFNREVRLALSMMDEVHAGKEWILPVRLDETPMPQIEVDGFEITDIQHTDFFGPQLARNLDRFLQRLGVDQPDLSVIESDGQPRLRAVGS